MPLIWVPFSVGILFGMIDPVVLVAVKNKSVITSPLVRVDGGFLFDDLLDNRQSVDLSAF